MPRLYAYPATLSRSVAARATEREPNTRYTGERYIYKRHFASHRSAPRRVAPRRVAFPVRRPAQCPRRAVLRRTPPRVSREGALPTRRERCPSLSNYTCPLLAIASHLSFLSAPTFILPFPFSFLSLFFFFPSFLRSPSRLVFVRLRRVSSNAIMLGACVPW